MSYSSDKKHKLIFENWRRFLKEDAIDDFIKGSGKGLHDYTAMLKSIAGDPEFRKLALSGRDDSAGPADESIQVHGGKPVPAIDLVPTQFDIDTEKSLGDQMVNRFNGTEYALEEGSPILMGSKEGRIPVLVFDNKYILDGHHRWSQVVMTNPGGIMAVDNLSAPAFGSGQEGAELALKATQLAIAGIAGNVVTNDTDVNLLEVDVATLEKYVLSRISDEVVQMLFNAEKIPKADKRLAAKMYGKNLMLVQRAQKGKFQRKLGMPQAADSGTNQAKVNKALEQGLVNFDSPERDDIKGKK
jgi:hypothetical protein